jgi:two-component system, LytTR family, sensor kinase
MNNILPDRRFLFSYLLIWIIGTLVWFSVIHWNAGLGWQLSLADALISTSLLFFLLLTLWHVVRYSLKGRGKAGGSFVNSFMASLVLLAIWFFLSAFVLERLFPDNVSYLGFLHRTTAVRILGGFFLSVIINLGFIVLHLTAETKEAAVRELNLQNLVQRTELQALKNQLNPHFIYNSLNAISSLTITSPEKAREMIIKLSDFLRFALKQDATQSVTLGRELEAIRLYLQIEQIRFGDRLQVHFNTEENHLQEPLPVMILQPLFENAIKHGVQSGDGHGIITFASRVSGNDLVLTMTNPYDHRFHRFRSEGVGLENIRNRLRVIYGNGQLLQVHTNDNRFTAILTLPTKKKK